MVHVDPGKEFIFLQFCMVLMDSTHQDKPICTLKYMNLPIKNDQKLPLKIECALHKGGGAQICTRELDPIAAALNYL